MSYAACGNDVGVEPVGWDREGEGRTYYAVFCHGLYSHETARRGSGD